MKVLALYDIHGNLDALEAVLADPRARDCDAVLVGGDAVPGPYARRTLERLSALAGPVHWIRGNGEREVSQAGLQDAVPSDDVAGLTASATARELGARRTWLGRLPLVVTLDGVLYCHATPRRDTEILTRISAPERWVAALSGVRASLVIAGHTHQQDDRQVGTVRFVNAGSVGMPYEGDGAARWLRVIDGEPELCRTPYDAVATGRRILADGWPDAESITAALIDPMDPDLITREFETAAAGGG